MDEKEVLLGVVGKTLNIPNEEITALLYGEDGSLNQDVVDKIAELDAMRIQTLKKANTDELTKMHDKGYKKAQAESLAKFEKEIKEEFGITDSPLVGKELVKQIISTVAKNTQVDENTIKLHPKFLELERKLTSEYVPKQEYDKVNTEFEAFKKDFEKRQTVAVISQDAIKVFRSLKPVLSKDPQRAMNQEIDFIQKLTSAEYDIQQDGNHIIKIDGKRLENANGHAISFSDFVKNEASKYFDFELQGDKGSPANKTDNDGKSIIIPKTKAEYITAVANETDPMKRIALREAWESSQK